MRAWLTSRAERILEALSRDRWMRAGEIARRVGLSAQRVARVIKSELLYVYVERRPARRQPWRWEYRRIA